ncbi:hypothetical protein ISCGN_016469 [Ixodes scapularis]
MRHECSDFTDQGGFLGVLLFADTRAEAAELGPDESSPRARNAEANLRLFNFKRGFKPNRISGNETTGTDIEERFLPCRPRVFVARHGAVAHVLQLTTLIYVCRAKRPVLWPMYFSREIQASAGVPQELSRCAPTLFEGLMTRSVIRALNYVSAARLTCTTEISGQFRSVILGPSSGTLAAMPLAAGRDLQVHSSAAVTSADSSRSASVPNVSAQEALVSSPLPRLTS